MTAFTPKDISDILLQKPYRITAQSNEHASTPELSELLHENKQGWLSRLFGRKDTKTLAQHNTEQDRSLTKASAELQTLGFSKEVVSQHIEIVTEIAYEEYQQSLMLSLISSGPEVFFSNNIATGPEYHLGIQNLDIKDQKQEDSIRNILEKRVSHEHLRAMKFIAKNHPELFDPKLNGPNHAIPDTEPTNTR